MKFQKGSKHKRWKGGKRVIKQGRNKGYVEITAGRFRHKREHWAIMYVMLEKPIGLGLGTWMLESGEFEVDHVDHVRGNNDPGNLLLLQKCIHRACSGFADFKNGKYRNGSQGLSREDLEYLEEIANVE